jgi:hypothetical protein
LTEQKTLEPRPQFTGNAGVNYAAWQLSRRGWHVMPTIRNARGSDLFVTDSDGTVFLGVQSKALSKRNPVPLGKDLATLQSAWWVITIRANSDTPSCYVLRLDEVRALAGQDKNGGAWWLDARHYDKDEFREAWDRISHDVFGRNEPRQADVQASSKAARSPREERNGVKRPGPGGKCAAVWDYLDIYPDTISAEMYEVAAAMGWNLNNTKTEFSQWRRFHGKGRAQESKNLA